MPGTRFMARMHAGFERIAVESPAGPRHKAARVAATFFFAMAVTLAQDPVAKGIDEFHRGQYQTAKAALEQALKENPGSAHARTFLALTRAATGGCDAVVADLDRKSTRLNSSH